MTQFKSKLSGIKEFFILFFEKLSSNNVTSMAAALAYYTTLSFAPLIVLFLSASAIVGTKIQNQFIDQVQRLVGPQAGEAVQLIIQSAKDRPDLTSLSGFLGFAILAFSASVIFAELKGSLNIIFEIEAPKKNDSFFLWALIKERVLSIGYVMSFIFLLITSLIVSSSITAFLPGSEQWMGRLISITLSLAVLSALFTLIYRFVPNVRMAWWDSFRGGAMTSLLFTVGVQLVGKYLGSSGVGSAYGAAGSIIVILIWVYYTSIIIFAGAQITSIWSHHGDQSKKAQFHS